MRAVRDMLEVSGLSHGDGKIVQVLGTDQKLTLNSESRHTDI